MDGAEIKGGDPSGGHLSAPRKDRRIGGHSPRVPIPGHAPVVWLLTCSVSPKESLWMTWVMSGFWGWAEALCVDTWKLPGTWGERRVPGGQWADPGGWGGGRTGLPPRVGHVGFGPRSVRPRDSEEPQPPSEPQVPRLQRRQ